MLGALFEFDTNYGRWPEPVTADAESITVGGERSLFVDVSGGIPDWAALGVDLVVDCTGRATSREGAQAHLDRGARRVLVSALSKSPQDCDAVLLRGINADTFDPDQHRIVSMASCTTNALAPATPLKGILAVLEEEYSSARILGETHSSVVDLPLIQVIGERMVSVAAWYDNEMGYATRLAEMAAQVASL
ncbi:MAG: glyceraldehyde 3-phosphate dehydrogenase NAD-binding domain-containing protein [Acidimicrobiales bacterium]